MNLLFRNGKKINQADGTSDTSKADKTNLSTISATGSTNNTGSTIKAGTYFYLDGVLKRAKTDISNGASFTSSNMESGDNALNTMPVLYASSYITVTTSSSQPQIATLVLPKGHYVIWEENGVSNNGLKTFCATLGGYTQNIFNFSLSADTTLTIQSPASASHTWTNYRLFCLKVG